MKVVLWQCTKSPVDPHFTIVAQLVPKKKPKTGGEKKEIAGNDGA